MSERIGWIGLGLLGAPMASNLQKSGYNLTVYNRTAEKAKSLAKSGSMVAAEPLEIATKGGIVVSVLWNSDVTEELLSPEFLKRMEGGVHIGMCTGSAEGARRLAKLHEDHGSSYVEAPVFGRPEAAEARQLTIPYAGCSEAKERAKPVLTALGGQSLFDTGEQPGVPSVIKQLGNFLIISMGRSLTEGLAIAESAGVAPLSAVDILGNSLFAFPLFRNYGKAVAEKKPALASPIPAKDLGLFDELAREHGLPNPIAQTLLNLTRPPE